MTVSNLQRVSLYLYFFTLNFDMLNVFGLGSPAKIASAIYLALMIPSVRHLFKTDNTSSYTWQWLLLCLYITVISIFFPAHWAGVKLPTALFLNIVVFFFLVKHEAFAPGVIRQGFYCFGLGAVVLTSLYYADVAVSVSYGRVSVLGGNENMLAINVAIGILALYFLFMDLPIKPLWARFVRFTIVSSFVPMFYFILATGSRKGLLALGFSIVLISLFSGAGLRRRVLISLGGLMLISLGLNEVISNDLVMSRFLTDMQAGGIENRQDLWTVAISVIESNYIFGVGLGGLQDAYMQSHGEPRSPHNVFLEIWAVGGVFCFLLFCNLLRNFVTDAYSHLRYSKNIMPMCFLSPVFALILAGQILDGKLVWSCFALCVYHSALSGSANSVNLRQMLRL